MIPYNIHHQRCFVLLLALLMLFGGVHWVLAQQPEMGSEEAVESGEYRTLYIEGLRALDIGKWNEALMLFAAASRAQPMSKEWIRPYGMRYEPYLPFYQIGVCLYELERFDQALEAWDESVRQGTIAERRNKRFKRKLEALRRKVEAQGPDIAARQDLEIAEAADHLQTLLDSPNFPKLDTTERDAAIRLGEQLHEAGASHTLAFDPRQEVLREAWQRIDILQRALARLERERLANARQVAEPGPGEGIYRPDPHTVPRIDSRRARTLETALSTYLNGRVQIAAGACSDTGIARLEEAVRALGPADAHAIDEIAPGLVHEAIAYRPHLTLARAYRNCGRVDGVARALGLARKHGEVGSESTHALELWLSGREALQRYGESHALLIAAQNYTRGWEPLEGPRQDINAVSATLERHGFQVETVDDPTLDDLKKRIEDFIQRHAGKAKNRLLFYYAGHGWTASEYGVQLGYLVPVDAAHPEDESTALTGFLSMDSFEDWAQDIVARHALFLFDSCFSGTIFEATRSVISEKPVTAPLEDWMAHPVRLFISAGAADEEVPDASVFRPAVIAALTGQADGDADGIVLGSELGTYVRDEVSRTSNTEPQWGKMSVGDLGRGDVLFASLEPRTDESHRTQVASERDVWQAWRGQNPNPDTPNNAGSDSLEGMDDDQSSDPIQAAPSRGGSSGASAASPEAQPLEPTQSEGWYSEDGVDLTLIRWMLSLSYEDRLQAAQDMVDTVFLLRQSSET